MCFGSINPEIQHGASQDIPCRVVEHEIKTPKAYRFHNSVSKQYSSSSFSVEESKQETYSGWTGTLGSISRQKTKAVKKQSSFDREQARLPIDYGWTGALGKDPRTVEEKVEKRVMEMSSKQRSDAVK
ncbi:hypothetical protein VTL71DRAFT_4528 [Oculimacula yallundae]|uniref:Uncharacterized protein n=1 Tax=Oculimacula yallundae TaxID=86028 RepID=A0ABR4C2A4_9HELO